MRKEHISAHELQQAMQNYLPTCRVTYELQSDSYMISEPGTDNYQRVTSAVLHDAPSLKCIAGHMAMKMRMRTDQSFVNVSVGFYGASPGPSSIRYGVSQPPKGLTFDLKMIDDVVKSQSEILTKEKAKMLPEATCPRCLAPEEGEITKVEQTFRVDVEVNGTTVRSFIVNAFDSVDALTYATEILQDEAEDGAEAQISGLVASVLVNTEILI